MNLRGDGGRNAIDLAAVEDFALGDVRVRPSRREVHSGDAVHVLEPKVMKVLVALARAGGDVVSRDTLIADCWDGVVVGDDSINRCIVQLRHLAQQVDPPAFAVRSVRGSGYFLEILPRPGAPHIARPRLRAALAIAALVAAAAAVLIAARGGVADRPDPRLLVVTSPANRDPAVLLAAMTESLAATGTAMHLVGQGARDPAAQQLVLTVSLHPDDRVTGLSLARAGQSLWGMTLPNTGQRAAANVAARAATCVAEAEAASGATPARVATYAGACVTLYGQSEEPQSDIAALQRLLADQPDFLAAWARLFDAHRQQLDRDPYAPAARAQAIRHLRTAPPAASALPEAALARAALLGEHRLVERDALYQQALRRHPDHPLLLAASASLMARAGAYALALHALARAARLDPASPLILGDLAVAQAFSGRVDAALATLDRAESRWPAHRQFDDLRYLIHLRVGDPRAATRLAASGLEPVSSNFTTALLAARADPSPARVALALEQARRARAASPLGSVGKAQALAAFDRTDELIAYLASEGDDQARQSIATVLLRPAFDDLHRDPRFIDIAAAYGLLDYYRRANRWPDFCLRPDWPYDCRAEAARRAPTQEPETGASALSTSQRSNASRARAV